MIFTMNETYPDTIEIDIVKHETIEIDTEKMKSEIIFSINDAIVTYFNRYVFDDIDFYDLPREVRTLFIKKMLKLIDKEEFL